MFNAFVSPHAARAALVLTSLGFSVAASAHISYSGRDFGVLTDGSAVTISNQTVSSNYGWADASDVSLVFNAELAATRDASTDAAGYVATAGVDELYLGDSHKGRAFKLHLDSAQSVTITAAALNNSGLTPAFSVYQGLATTSPFVAPQTSADHDYATASQAWRTAFAQSVAGSGYTYLATNGSWNALGNWAIGGDGDPAGDASALDGFTFLGYAASTVVNGVASTALTLGPGDYTILLGGNDISSREASVTSYAFSLSVSASAVPEPSGAVLMCLGLLGLGAWVHRRHHATR